MGDFPGRLVYWGYYAVWAAGGLALLVRYRRHPRASRRAMLAVGVWLALVLPLRLRPDAVGTACEAVADLPGLTGFRVYQWALAAGDLAALLLLARAAVTDRPRTADLD